MSNRDVNKLLALVKRLTRRGRGMKKVTDTLLTDNYTLDQVVMLQNAEITRAFLSEKENIRYGESYASIHFAVLSLDIANTKVLLENGPEVASRREIFVRLLIVFSTKAKMQYWKLVQVFVEQMVKWNVLDERAISTIEYDLILVAGIRALRIFLQHGFDSFVENLLNRSILPMIFGNPRVNVGALFKNKIFDPNARGQRGSRPLHIAALHLRFDNMKFLLDRGADPNLTNDDDELPLSWAMENAKGSKVAETLQCIELLLQYGANVFLSSGRIGLFIDFVFFYEKRYDYLEKITIAYAAIQMARRNVSVHVPIFPELSYPMDHLQSYHRMCRRQILTLMLVAIREGFTMDIVLYHTGKYLFRRLNGAERKKVSEMTTKFSRAKTLNRYYIRTLREHIRQVKDLAKCENRAMFVIADVFEELIEQHFILKKITSYFTYDDLLKFK